MSSMLGNQGYKSPTGTMSGQKLGGYKVGQLPNFSPEQMQLFQSLFSHVGPDSYLSKLAGGDQSQFQAMEEPALKQFSGMQGNLASRFSGMGMGARRSSGFQNTANQASMDFASQLQANRQQLQRQALMDLMGMSQSLLGQRSYENVLIPRRKSYLEELGIGAATGLGQGLGMAGSMYAL